MTPCGALPGPCSRVRLSGCGVGDELPVDGVGDPALEAPQRLEGFPAVGALAPTVGPPVGGQAALATQTRSFSGRDVRGKYLSPARPLVTADEHGNSAAGIDIEQYFMTRVLVCAVGPKDAHRDRVAVRPESV